MRKGSNHIPIRTCITCGAKRSKAELLRLSLGEEGRVVRDDSGRKQGRGAYVCKTGPCMEHLPRARWERALRIKRGVAKV